jgi:ATP-dependent RNA helicase DDX18/HAS1
MEFSHNKFVGINDKLREFVEQSYDLNRKGFYAYGSYINYFRANLLKKIFRTDQINVGLLAKSFGFTTPPRVKEGNFLTEKARIERKADKIKQKKLKEAKP